MILKMQFIDEEEEIIHHEVPSDEEIDIIDDPQPKVGPTPVQNVRSQALQVFQSEEIMPINRSQFMRTHKGEQEAKSFTNIFRNKQVRPLQKITTQDNEQEDQQNIQQYRMTSEPVLPLQQQQNQQIKQTQEPILSQQQQYQQKNLSNIQIQQLQQQIPQQQQQRKGLFSNKYDDIKRQKYMRLISTHFANQPDFQEAAIQVLNDPNMPDFTHQLLQAKQSQRAQQRCDQEEKSEKPQKRLQFSDLHNTPYQSSNPMQVSQQQQYNSRLNSNIEYIQAINFDDEQAQNHICNDKQDLDDIDDGVDCFLPQQLQDRVIIECREQGLIRIPEQDSLEYPDYENVHEKKRFWIPIKGLPDIPPQFYMTKKFDWPIGLANADPSTIKTPYDAFRLFFNKDIYDMIVNRTNKKLIQDNDINLQAFIDGSNPNRPNLPTFRLNEPLLDAFLASQLYQGMMNIKKTQDCWERSKVPRGGLSGGYQSPNEDDDNFVAGKMGHIIEKGLYDQIKQNLYISDNNKVKSDPLAKVRDFLIMINENFKKHYNPEEFLVVDEGIIPFEGKVKFKVFNPDRPNQRGIKEYLICDAVRAYTLEVKFHCGDQKSGVANFQEPPDKVMEKTMEMVLSLLLPYQGKQHKVIMDNYYTSPELFSKLKSLEIGAIGTIRHDRTGLGNQELDDQHFQKIYPPYKEYMSYLSVDNDNILTYFQGTNEKECALLSSFVDTTRNFQHKASIQKSDCRMTPYQTQPFMIYLYNKYRGGCDKRNSFVSVWRSKNRTQKWWRVIFDRLFQTAVTNAAIIMRIIYPEKTTKLGWLKDFRRALMHEMIQKYRDYVMTQDPKMMERWGKSQRNYNSHNLVEGQLEVNCVECGSHTHVMCQECSMMNDCIVGVCKDNEEACQRYHMCAGSGWDVTRAQDPLFSQISQQNMQRKNHRHRGRPSTWATIKQLREYKMQLEIENEKVSQRTNEYDKAISLLNETLGQLVKQDPDNQISNDLSSLLQQLAEILPDSKDFAKLKVKGDSTLQGKKEVLKEEKEQNKPPAIIDLRDRQGNSKQEKMEKKEQSQKFNVIINLEEDDEPQEEMQVEVNLGDPLKPSEKSIQGSQMPQSQTTQQKINQQITTKNQQQSQPKEIETESKAKKKTKVLGKMCQIVNF